MSVREINWEWACVTLLCLPHAWVYTRQSRRSTQPSWKVYGRYKCHYITSSHTTSSILNNYYNVTKSKCQKDPPLEVNWYFWQHSPNKLKPQLVPRGLGLTLKSCMPPTIHPLTLKHKGGVPWKNSKSKAKNVLEWSPLLVYQNKFKVDSERKHMG